MVRLDHEDRTSILGQDSRIRRQPSVWVDDDPGGVAAGNLADCQLRIVGDDRADPDDNGIDQCPKPMQMQDRLGAIDIAGTAGRGGNSPVERLAKLADDERPLAISSGDGLVELPKRLSCVRIRRTDDVMARSKPYML
jgi:hypothetical protein